MTYGCVMLILFLVVFFFKQKTAYEMRISDWSSDVCSSDLAAGAVLEAQDHGIDHRQHHQTEKRCADHAADHRHRDALHGVRAGTVAPEDRQDRKSVV